MTGALHAEWTKLRTVASTGWLLLGVIAATVALSATASAARSCGPAAGCHPDLTRLSLTGVGLGRPSWSSWPCWRSAASTPPG